MEPRLVSLPPMYIIGIKTRTTNTSELDASTAKIPALWKQYSSGAIPSLIPHKKSECETYDVYTEYEKDHTGYYALIIGAQVTTLDAIPQAMVGITIPEQKYLVFSGTGAMPETCIRVWKEIWTYFQHHQDIKRAYMADFELRDAKKPHNIEIYISVNP